MLFRNSILVNNLCEGIQTLNTFGTCTCFPEHVLLSSTDLTSVQWNKECYAYEYRYNMWPCMRISGVSCNIQFCAMPIWRWRFLFLARNQTCPKKITSNLFNKMQLCFLHFIRLFSYLSILLFKTSFPQKGWIISGFLIHCHIMLVLFQIFIVIVNVISHVFVCIWIVNKVCWNLFDYITHECCFKLSDSHRSHSDHDHGDRSHHPVKIIPGEIAKSKVRLLCSPRTFQLDVVQCLSCIPRSSHKVWFKSNIFTESIMQTR